MSQAEMLLNSLYSSEETDEVDTTLVIDRYLRAIKVPKSITNLGVESDDGVMRVQFKMPATYCGIDLTTFKIRINYLNAKNEGDVYEVTDVKKVGDNLTFSWLVGRHAALYKGKVKFIVCMKDTDSSGNVLREFNTTITTLPILEGLETGEEAVIEYTDLMEQWREMLFGIGNTEETRIKAASETEQENIAQKGVEVLATIPEDYTTTYEMADNAYRTRANAIVSTVDGEIISVSDASDDPLRGLRVFGKTNQTSTTGKNLLNIEENITLSNVHGIDVALEADTYIVSLTSESHSGDQSPYLRFYTNNVWIQLKNGLAQSAVLTQPETKVYLYTYGMSASESAGVTARLNQLMVSKTGGDYEPYSGGVASPSPEWLQDLISKENPTIDVYGKNLLKEPAIGSTTTGNGITCTYEGNGVYHFTGTYNHVTESVGFVNVWMNMPIDPNAEYTISAKLLEGTPPCYFHPYIGLASDVDAHRNWLAVHVGPTMSIGSVVTATGMPKHHLSDAKTLNKFWIYLYNDTREAYTVDFRIQVWVERSSKSTEYRPYSKQSFVLAHVLSGVPVSQNGNYTDANGQQWVCDEIDFERGVYVQRVALATMETGVYTDYILSTSMGSGQLVIAPNPPKDQAVYGTLCNVATRNPEALKTVDGQYYENPANVVFVGAIGEDEASIRAKYESFELLYVLATPIETALTAEEIETFKALHSNYPNTTVLNDADATMELKYNADTKLYLESCLRPGDEQVQNAVDAWLEAHFSSAEGVSF